MFTATLDLENEGWKSLKARTRPCDVCSGTSYVTEELAVGVEEASPH